MRPGEGMDERTGGRGRKEEKVGRKMRETEAKRRRVSGVISGEAR